MMNNNNTIKHQKTQTTFFIPILAHTRRENKQKASRFLFYNSGIQFSKQLNSTNTLPTPPSIAFTKSNDDSSRNQQRIGRFAKRAMTKSYAKWRTVQQETFIPLENHSSISATGFVQNRPLPNAFGTCES